MSTTYTDLTETQFPDKVDDLSRMSDLTTSDLTLVNQYYTYYNAGNLAAAAQLLIDNPTLMNKIFNAAKFNILRDALIALQRYYKSDVQTYIDSTKATLQTEINDVKSDFQTEINDVKSDFQTEIDRFTALGEYNASTQYAKHNIVTWNGNGYVCTAACKNIAPDTTTGTNYWQLIVSKGDKGDSGTGLTFRGQYSSTTAYTLDDCVTDGTSIWAAKKASTGQALAEGEYWTIVMQINRRRASATITASGWIGNTQTVSVAGVMASGENENDIFVFPVTECAEEWGNCTVVPVAQIENAIVFNCELIPTKDIDINILLFE